MANKQPRIQFLVPGGKRRLEQTKVRKQISLTPQACIGLEQVARSYGLLRDEKGDISQLLELVGQGNLIVVPKPPNISKF